MPVNEITLDPAIVAYLYSQVEQEKDAERRASRFAEEVYRFLMTFHGTANSKTWSPKSAEFTDTSRNGGDTDHRRKVVVLINSKGAIEVTLS